MEALSTRVGITCFAQAPGEWHHLPPGDLIAWQIQNGLSPTSLPSSCFECHFLRVPENCKHNEVQAPAKYDMHLISLDTFKDGIKPVSYPL
jgi:hypothetical protein